MKMQILMSQEIGDATFSGWNLNTGGGDRYYDKVITFQVPLSTPPLVQVNLVKVDADKQFNLRVEVLVQGITINGFTLRFHTWADTKLYSVKANWIAVTA
jgi:hypothetical protein